MMSHRDALSRARDEHVTEIVWGERMGDGDTWLCSCGTQGRDQKTSLKKMTASMAEAGARRHVEAAARRIQKAEASS